VEPELLRELLTRLGGDGEPLTDTERAELRAAIYEIRAGIDLSDPSPEDIATLTEVRDNLNLIATQDAAVAAERQERADQAAAIAAEIPDLPVPEAAETEAEVPAEGDVVAEAESVVADAPAPVAAAATPPERLRPPTISHLAARTPRRNAPVSRPATEADEPKRYGSTLVASANLSSIPAGAAIDGERYTLRQFGKAVQQKVRAIVSSGGGEEGEKIYFAQKITEFPPDRYLRDSDSEEDVERKFALAASGIGALTAAGGICGPVDTDWSVQGISVADRPLTGAAIEFGAGRGGLRYVLPRTLAQVTADGPAGLWTAANDANPTNPTVKAHATFVCQTVKEDYVDAITSAADFSNFQTMFSPEQTRQYMEQMDVVHARLAESTMFKEMIDGATWRAVESTTLLGTTRDILAAIDRSAAAIRYRNRTGMDSPLRVVYPEWLEDSIRTDLARQLPGDSGTGIERLATADAEIDRFFTVRNINVTKALDSPTGESVLQGWVVQGDGPLLPWPTTATIMIYPEGSYTHMNGGELNLGMIRSATLALTNQVRFFSETFEKMIFRGHEAGVIRVRICPSGQTAGTVDTSLYCQSGS
jgi:hypothetical protein